METGGSPTDSRQKRSPSAASHHQVAGGAQDPFACWKGNGIAIAARPQVALVHTGGVHDFSTARVESVVVVVLLEGGDEEESAGSRADRPSG